MLIPHVKSDVVNDPPNDSLNDSPNQGQGSALLPQSALHPQIARKRWFAAYTAPRHEKFVQAQLVAKQIQSFLPIYTAVRRWKNGVKREIQHPLLPGYVFVSLSAGERLPVLRTEGGLYQVGNGAMPVPLDDCEVHALRVGAERASLLPHALPGTGDRVCIKSGPFQGVRGFVEQDKGDLTFVVTIELIQKSFAIRVQADELELAS